MIVGLYQLSQFAVSKNRAADSVSRPAGLTPEQIKEFEGIHGRQIQRLRRDVQGLKELDQSKGEGGFAAPSKKLPELLKTEQKRVDEMSANLKSSANRPRGSASDTSVRWVGNVPFVTDDCARSLSSIFVLETAKLGESAMRQLNREERSHDALIKQAREFLGLPAETKAGGALTPTDIPLPTIYVPQIIELVFAYGAARQYATVFPLGAGTVKLPRLQAGEDAFAFLGVGTAGMSQSARPERK